MERGSQLLHAERTWKCVVGDDHIINNNSGKLYFQEINWGNQQVILAIRFNRALWNTIRWTSHVPLLIADWPLAPAAFLPKERKRIWKGTQVVQPPIPRLPKSGLYCACSNWGALQKMHRVCPLKCEATRFSDCVVANTKNKQEPPSVKPSSPGLI